MQPATKTFGRYSLLRKLAQGGMAEIFLAKFRGEGGFEKKVIIKRILPRFSQNQEFIKMLVHEAKLAVQLHHANIVQIYDLGRIKDTYFISMEYIKGKDLRTVLNRCKSQDRTMTEALAVFVAREMCKGLEYAHSFVNESGEALNLVHRDISPPNVLLSLDGEVKIIDFGIAKATAKATDTQAGVFKGKFAYMAPEQASGLPVDRRIDIFASGLILYEMFTNIKLLDAETDIQTLERAKNIESVALDCARYGIGPDLEKIIRRALTQDREKRYQTAGDMARDLSIYLNTRYPAFSSDEMGSFMREVFNLNRGGGAASLSVDDHESEGTDSDFFVNIGNVGDLEPDEPAVSTVELNPQPSRRGRNLEEGSGDYWSLDDALKEEIQVFSLTGGGPGPSGKVGGPGWVSQVAEGFDTSESGTMRPVVGERDDSVERTLHSSEVSPRETAASEQSGRESERSYVWQVVGGFLSVLAILVAALLLTPARHAAQLPDQVMAIRSSLLSTLGVQVEAILVVKTSPPDAEVYLDGSLRGTSGETRVSLMVDRPYTITVRKDGYEQAIRPVTLEGDQGEVTLPVALIALPPDATGLTGKISVVSDPPGARVFIEGREQVGRLTPAQIDGLYPGQKVKVKLEKSRYESFEAEVVPGETEIPEVSGKLVPGPVELRVVSTPEGAKVSLDEREQGITPLTGVFLEPGASYRVQISKDKFQDYSESITTTAGEDVVLRVALASTGSGGRSRPLPLDGTEKAPAKLQVPANPGTNQQKSAAAGSDAAQKVSGQNIAMVSIKVESAAKDVEIIINGANVGTSLVQGLPLAPGRYTVRLRSRSRSADIQVFREVRPEDVGTQVTWVMEL